MVNHHGESAGEVLSQKATLWTSTDHGLDAFSTPKIAPATPMQAWQKPLHRHESPDALPSLSLGRSSAELKAAVALHPRSMPAKCGLVSAPTPSRLHSGAESCTKGEVTELPKESLFSFSLSQYEKGYDLATPLRNHMGPSSSHRVRAPAADSQMLPNIGSAFPHEVLAASVVGADESPPHALVSSLKTEPAADDAEMVCKSDDSSPQLCSPVPGEVANDAYKLYSQLFPSANTFTADCLSPSVDMDVQARPFFRQMGSMQSLPHYPSGHKPLAWDRCVHIEAKTEGGKNLKVSVKEERVGSKRLLVPKQEPDFEETYSTQELTNCGDASLTSACDATLKDYSGQCDTTVVQKDFAFPKSSHGQTEHLATSLSSSISKKAADCIMNLGKWPLEEKPAVGLKLFTSSEDAQPPICSSKPFAGEPLSFASKIGACQTPVQGNSYMDADWGKFLALSATPSGNTDTKIMLPFMERFKNLQAFLKQCDEADQNEQLRGLSSLSAAARSSYAVELETRAIHLSLEEGKELKRMRFLNVLGKTSESSPEDLGATPQGPRLPVLGATASCTQAP